MNATTRINLNERRVFLFDPKEGHRVSIPRRNLDLWLLSVTREQVVADHKRVIANELARQRYSNKKTMAQNEQDWENEQLSGREEV